MPVISAREGVVVPFVDLAALHRPLKEELFAAIDRLIERSEFGEAEAVADFERAFAAYSGAQQCVGVASGLDALRLALQAGGMASGDEVIVPAHTFVATYEAVTQAGGVPVPVDVCEDDFNVDVDAVAIAVGIHTRFVLPVHLYGQLANMRRLLEVAASAELQIVEDAAQAHGASRDGYSPGDGSLAACFSFYPAKNLGAMGDAGALVTNDDGLARTVSALREHGQSRKYEHEFIGWTSRLDAIQAAVLSAKLPHLDRWNGERAEVARSYDEQLRGLGDLRLPEAALGSKHAWHLYVVRTADPEGLAAFLGERGVHTGRHYPEPPHLSQAYRHLGFARGAFPVAEQLARESLSLPIFPGMTEAQVSAVVSGVEQYFAHG